MFRKRRRPTPHFKIPSPYNPIQGENANLRQDGVSPFCAMVQVMEEDTYDDYVICRMFDTRILKYIENVSVAKPFGKRLPDTYEIGEIYPALLPTQGNANFMDFRQVVYTPPSPVAVQWRVGQNPGVVVGGLEGGQPEGLSDVIQVLYDHNGKAVNWILLDGSKSGSDLIEYTINSMITSAEPDYVGLKKATVTVRGGPAMLVGASVSVYDHSGCIFNEPEMEDYTGWAFWGQFRTLDVTKDCEVLTPKHWAAVNRCCAPNSGTYRECAE
jgi:hypothetical protein